MKGYDILQGLSHIDESFIQEAEVDTLRKNSGVIKLVLPIAASFVILFTSLLLWQRGGDAIITPNGDNLGDSSEDIPPISTTQYSLHLNDTQMVSDARVFLEGHFWYALDEVQLSSLLPNVTQKHDTTGSVHYSSKDDEASLFEVYTYSTISESIKGSVTVALNEIVHDVIIDGEAISSEIEGVEVTAGLFVTDKNSKGERNYIYYAEFMLGEISYYAELVSYGEEANTIFTQFVADIILGGEADLSVFDNPIIPELIDEELTESEAYAEADFGSYLFDVPSDYAFNSAYRWLNQTTNSLFASWSKGYSDISISVSEHNEDSISRLVSPEQTELYDILLYSIPWADSMPSDTRHIIQNPVFKIEELTQEMIEMRGYVLEEVGDPSSESVKMSFCVLYGDVVVDISCEGLSASYLYEQLSKIGK